MILYFCFKTDTIQMLQNNEISHLGSVICCSFKRCFWWISFYLFTWHVAEKIKTQLITTNLLFTKGKDYSGAKFFYTEPISLNKAHSTKRKAFDDKTLHLYNHSLYKMLLRIPWQRWTSQDRTSQSISPGWQVGRGWLEPGVSTQ